MKFRHLIIFTLLASAVSLFFGSTGIPDKFILFNFRLPRVLMGIIVGGALSASGAVMQGVLRNPLADPYILGSSAGASLGVILCSFAGIGQNSVLSALIISLCAFCAVFTSYSLAKTKGRATSSNLLLAGVLVNTFLGSLILFSFVALKEKSFQQLVFMMGYLSEGTRESLIFSSVLFILGLSVVIPGAKYIDILSLGEEKAQSLGVNAEKIKIILLACCGLMVGGAVSVAGAVGFVGLIIPHIMRLIFGGKSANLIIASAIGGAGFTVFMDALARSAFAWGEIPVGILTALCGAPFFLYLLKKNKGYLFQ